MATALGNLSEYNADALPDGSPFKIHLVVSEWNNNITEALLQGAQTTLVQLGVRPEHLKIWKVPGSFELVYGCKRMIKTLQLDAIIAIGNVIQGETKHFDFVCNGVTQGIVDLNVKHDTPIIFCVLTDNTKQQSIDRSGGKYGNKGIESAIAAIKMASLS